MYTTSQSGGHVGGCQSGAGNERQARERGELWLYRQPFGHALKTGKQSLRLDLHLRSISDICIYICLNFAYT